MPFDISSFSLTPEQLKKADDIRRDPILSKIGVTGGIPYKSTDAYKFINDPNRKMLGYDAFRNNDYVYDEAQTTGQWWKNTAMRALNPLTTSFAESFRYDKTFQQLFTDKSMSDDEGLKNYIKRTEELNFLYPNYENANTKDGLLGYFSSGARNKWSNLLESSGFMIGTTLGAIGQTVALSALTGGAGAAPAVAEGISAISNASRYSRIANSFNMLNRANKLWQQTKASYIAGSQLFQGIEGVQQIKNATTAIGAVKGAAKILGNGAIAYQRASSEAMLESIEGSEHFYKQQLQEREQELGRPLTKEEKGELQDYSADLFSARYKANVGVLMTTNLLQDYNLFSSFQKISKTARLAGVAEAASKRQIYSKTLQKWVTAGALPMKEFAIYRAKQAGGFLVKNTLTEGLEESAQYAIDKSTNDYYTKKYNKEAVSFMDSLGKGLYSAVNDKEGQESFWAGVVMGGLFSGIGAAGTKVAGMVNGKNKMVAEMADANNDRLNKAQEDLLTLIKTEQVLSAETENATFNHTINDEIQNANDQETVTNLRKKVLVNAVKTAKEVGKYDVFMDNIKSLSELSEEDFKTKFEITDAATRPKSKEAYINELLQEATNIKNDLDMIDERYINPYQNYTSINPTKKPKERKEAFVKYKAWEEAKTVVLDNMANLRSTHKEVTENNTWFANKGVVAEDMISYIKEKSSPDRVEKIRSLTLDLDALHTVLSEKLPAKERADYVKQAKAIQKELDIYENLHSDPTNTKYRIALFNHLKKQNPDTPTILNSDKAFGEDLEIKLEQAVQAVDRNKQALEAIVALENSDIFSALAGNYEKRYNERYNIIVSDLEDGLTDAEKAAAQPTASELSPVTQEDVNKAMDSDGQDIAEYAKDTIARKQANNIPLTEEEEKLFHIANPAVKAGIEAIKNQIEANIKREAERAKDPEAFDKKEKIAEVEKSHKKKTEKIKEEIAEKEAKIAEIEKEEIETYPQIRDIADFSKEDEFYRVIVGDEAYNDIVSTNTVRTNAGSKPTTGKKEGIDLTNRPTAFPSFSKGQAAIQYAEENPNNYIVVSKDSSIKPSTSGRHGKGNTMFPTNESGEHLKELAGNKVAVYKHAGSGKYELVYLKGKEINTPNEETIKNSEEQTINDKKADIESTDKALEKAIEDNNEVWNEINPKQSWGGRLYITTNEIATVYQKAVNTPENERTDRQIDIIIAVEQFLPTQAEAASEGVGSGVGGDVESKKAETERRRQEELFNILSEEDKQIALKIPEGDKRNKWVKTRVTKTTKGNDVVERHNAEDALSTSTDIATRIAAKRKLESNQPFNSGSISDINKVIYKIKNDDILIGSEKLIKDYYDAELKALEQQPKSNQFEQDKKADIEIGKVGNTEYEVKVDGVYYQGKKLNNPENKTHRQLIEADIERRRQEELNINAQSIKFEQEFYDKKAKEQKDWIQKYGKNDDGIEQGVRMAVGSLVRAKEETSKIHAKYDAELRALEQTTPQSESKPALRDVESIENRNKQTEAKIKNKGLFLAKYDENGNKIGDSVGEIISQSDIAPIATSVREQNGFEFVEFSNPQTGEVDVIVTGDTKGNYVGFYRLYENGKPTNKWSSKMNSKDKNAFKTMMSGVQEMLPQGHEYSEKTSISTDGLRVWNQQLQRGYELQYDNNGKLITDTVAINGDALINELDINVNQGNFDNIRVSNKEDFNKVKKALLPYLEKFGLNQSNINWVNGTVEIDLPVLKKSEPLLSKEQSTSTTQSDIDAKKDEIERKIQEVEKIAKLPFKERIDALIKIGIIDSTISTQMGVRFPVIININGIKVPFYRSSNGTDGKIKGSWNPFFGFGKGKNGDSWLIKGNNTQFKNNYNSKAIEEYSKLLDNVLNWDTEVDKVRGVKNHPFMNTLQQVSLEEFNQEVYNTKDLNIINGTSGKTNPLTYVDNKIKEINAKYDAERIEEIEERRQERLKNSITNKDKIVFGHPTIGKSYLKQRGNSDFITLDDDYAEEVNAFVDKNRGSETRQEYKGRKPKEYNEFMLNLFDRLKIQAQKEGKRLFVSNTNILKKECLNLIK
jgi:hypothetical protein